MNAQGSAAAVLSVDGLSLRIGDRLILDRVSLDIPAGKITGIAGESGSGKSMTALTIMGLEPTDAQVSGSVSFDGENLLTLSPGARNRLRGRELAMVFQDPGTTFHPLLRIGTQLTDHVRHHEGLSRAAAHARAIELLARVQLPEPEQALRRYPHQFSGGQLQRISIASAIACSPRVLIADEPTTALDVTVQAGILRLLRGLATDLGLAVVLITHDLGVMSAVADTVTVMRDGVVVESGDRFGVLTAPKHPYTRALIDALPERGGRAPEATEVSEAPEASGASGQED